MIYGVDLLKKKNILFLLITIILLLITSYSFAYTYYAPLEPDNKLVIYGDGPEAYCNGDVCSYNYTVTNLDTIPHLINLSSYLSSTPKTTLTNNPVTLEDTNIELYECSKWKVTHDANGQDTNTCEKWDKKIKTEKKPKKGNNLVIIGTTANLAKGIKQDLKAKNNNYITKITQTNQIYLLAGETKEYSITFNPSSKKGELIITAISDSNTSIKASLDPTYNSTVFNLNFNDGLAPTDWTNGSTATWNYASFYAKTINNDNSGWVYKQVDTNQSTVSFAAKMTSASNGFTYLWIGDKNGSSGSSANTYAPTNGNGYQLAISCDSGSGQKVMLNKVVNGTRTVLVNSNTCGADYVLRADRNTDNWWEFYVNNSLIGTYNDSSSPITNFVYGQYYADNGTGTNKIDDANFVYNATALDYLSYGYVSPSGGEKWNGNRDLNFTIQDTNQTLTLKLLLYYSSIAGANQNLIYSDTNLKDGSGVLCNTTTPYDFSTQRTCGYIFNTTLATDGNYYIDSNLYNSDLNLLSSSNKFLIDNNAPFTQLQSNLSPTGYDFNFKCYDTNGTNTMAGCNTINYRIDSGTWTSVTSTDGNQVNYHPIGGGTHTLYYYSTDVIGNTEVTKSQAYTNESTPPTTSFSKTTIADNNNETTITLTCTDDNSGCASTQYRLDSGSWTTYTTPFTFTGIGHHTIDYNSTDNVGNIETTKTSDLNMPILLTILYPKNVQTLLQIDEKWNLRSIGGVTVDLTDLNTDQNIYVQPDIVTTLYISDVNGNYIQNTYTKTYYSDSNNGTTDTLQPYLYALATSLATVITAKDSYTNQPIPDVTIKIFSNIPGIGETLIGQVTTDSKGQALSLFIVGQSYTFQVYYNSVLVKTFSVTASSSTIVIYLTLQTSPYNPTTNGFTASFTPIIIGQQIYSTGNKVFTQTIKNFAQEDANYISEIIQGTTILSSQSVISSASTYTFTHTIPWSSIVLGDLTSRVTIIADTNTYYLSKKYVINNSFDTNYNIMDGLVTGVRSDMQCSATPDALTGLYPLCTPLLAIAIIISIALVIWISALTQSFSGQATGIIFAIPMALFTYLQWVPLELTVGVVIIILAFITYERR